MFKKKARSTSSFEVEDGAISNPDYQLLDDDEEKKLLDENNQPNNNSRSNNNQSHIFTPNVIYFDDARPENPSAQKNTKKFTPYLSRNESMTRINMKSSTRFLTLIWFAFITCFWIVLVDPSAKKFSFFSDTKTFIFLLSIFVIIPVIFIILECNIILLHNYYFVSFLEPFLLFLSIGGSIFLCVKRDMIEKMNGFLIAEILVIYVTCRLSIRLWVFVFRCELLKMIVFWLMTLIGFVHGVVVFDRNGNGEKEYLYVLRQWLVMVWGGFVVYWNTKFLRDVDVKFERISFVQLAMIIAIGPIGVKVIGVNEFLIVGVAIVGVVGLELMGVVVVVWGGMGRNEGFDAAVIGKIGVAVGGIVAVVVHAVVGLLHKNDTTYHTIDIFTFYILLLLLTILSFLLTNTPYLQSMTNFYSRSTFTNFNFMDDHDMTKLFNNFMSQTYKYSTIFSNPIVSFSSSITAPWIHNYKPKNSKPLSQSSLTYKLMIGLQSTSKIHATHQLTLTPFSNPSTSQFCCSMYNEHMKSRNRPSNIPNLRVYNSQDVRVRYEYMTSNHRPSMMEVVFESLAFTLTEFFPTEFAYIRGWSGISNDAFAKTFEVELVPFITNSKSGMFFFYTFDGKYLVKSLKKDEFTFFQKILTDYWFYLSENPNSLINKFFGMYRLQAKKQTGHKKTRSGLKNGNGDAGDGENEDDAMGANTDVSFIVMESIFYSDLDTHRIYDLKGSTKGRELSKKEKESMEVPVLKDLDFLNDNGRIAIGERARVQFLRQLEKDVEFLDSLEIMDYSLLLGVHDRNKSGRGGRGREQRDGNVESPLMFRYDHGGISGVGDLAHEIYFCGIIDILQRFNARKKVENVVKRIGTAQEKISCVPPNVYAKRMVDFLEPHVG